jgi:hypothetical protein
MQTFHFLCIRITHTHTHKIVTFRHLLHLNVNLGTNFFCWEEGGKLFLIIAESCLAESLVLLLLLLLAVELFESFM